MPLSHFRPRVGSHRMRAPPPSLADEDPEGSLRPPRRVPSGEGKGGRRRPRRRRGREGNLFASPNRGERESLWRWRKASACAWRTATRSGPSPGDVRWTWRR
eukprot:scaffold911_cov314-Pavlova_lutheri.AAC.3